MAAAAATQGRKNALPAGERDLRPCGCAPGPVAAVAAAAPEFLFGRSLGRSGQFEKLFREARARAVTRRKGRGVTGRHNPANLSDEIDSTNNFLLFSHTRGRDPPIPSVSCLSKCRACMTVCLSAMLLPFAQCLAIGGGRVLRNPLEIAMTFAKTPILASNISSSMANSTVNTRTPFIHKRGDLLIQPSRERKRCSS